MDCLDYFHASLQCSTAERPLIIHIDSLDQLSDADNGRRRLTWLPLVFPEHVYVTCSTLPDTGGCLDALRATPTPEYNYLDVPGLSAEVNFTSPLHHPKILCFWGGRLFRRIFHIKLYIFKTTLFFNKKIFMGPLIPLFWSFGDVCSGFQSQSGFSSFGVAMYCRLQTYFPIQ